MDHILGIEPIVPQLVQEDFVGREIDRPVREGGADLLQGKQEDGFAYLVAVRSVGKMAEKNKRVVESTREDVIASGYEPCKICKP